MEPSDAGAKPKPIVIDALQFKSDDEGYIGKELVRHLYLFDVDGKHLEQLTTRPRLQRGLTDLVPDGRQIAFIRTREIGADPDGRAVHRRDRCARGRHRARSGATLRAQQPEARLESGRNANRVPARIRAEVLRLHAGPAVHGAGHGRQSARVDGQARSRGDVVRVQRRRHRNPRRGRGRPHRLPGAGRSGERLDRTEGAGGTVRRFLAVRGRRAYRAHRNQRPRARRSVRARQGTPPQAQRAKRCVPRRIAARRRRRHRLQETRPGRRSTGSSSSRRTTCRAESTRLCSGSTADRTAQDEHSFIMDGYQFEPQMFAAKGFVVLRVNYRGGSGRGSAYAKAIFADWGDKEVEDLLAGVDYLVARGIADPNAPRDRRLELRRNPDRLHDRERRSVQGRDQRRGQRRSDRDVRQRRIRSAVQQ